MNKRSLFATAITALLISLTPTVFAQTNAGVNAVLDPVTGSTLIIGSTFPVTAQVFNNGTTTITSMQIKFNIGINNTNTALDEIWTGSLAPGDTMSYTFTAQFTLNDTSNSSTFCLADAPGDSMPFNNSAYPVYSFAGPTAIAEKDKRDHNGLNIDHLIVIPGQEIQMKISFHNSTYAKVSLVGLDGRTLNSHTVDGVGSGQAVLNLSSLSRGVYILVVENKFGRLTEKIAL